MCYNGSGETIDRELTDDEWLDIVRQSIDLGIMEAIVSGGEPLMRSKTFVIRLLEMLSDSGISIHLITNGTFVDRDFVRSLRGFNLRIIQTSIDGHTPEIHNAIRQGRNFNNVVAATSLFASHGFYCRIGTTIVKMNEEHIEDILEFAVSLGSQEIVIDQFLPIGRSVLNYGKITTSRSHEDIRKEIERLGKAYADLITVRIGMLCQDQLQQCSDQEVNDSIIIRPNGDLRLGCMAPFTCGNVMDKGLRYVWETGGAYAWKSPKVTEYVNRVHDNASMMAEYKNLGVLHGYENEQI
jgi:MoaA/NifB/PqqE/SkfB family radical SAM enzyme